MKLTDITCKNAKADGKTRKLFDGKGLYLEVTPTGRKYWRLKYRFGGKEKRLALGVYPDISLSDAREETAIAKKQLRQGIDPTFAKRTRKLELADAVDNSFQKIAEEWLEIKEAHWSTSNVEKNKGRLKHHVYPYIGTRPIAEIRARELLEILRRAETKTRSDLAHRVRTLCSQIFRYAVITERAENDPAAPLLGALKPFKKKHFNRLDENGLKGFLPVLNNFSGDYRAKYGLMLILLTFVRSGELRGMKWSEIDLDNAIWTIPAERMKMKRTHTVPLSLQAIDVLKTIKEIDESSEYVFPNKVDSSKHMNENTMLHALRDMGYKGITTVHGFRATASTILNEQGYRPDVIERQLAHVEGNKVRSAYNHAEYLDERVKMMQDWADHLEKLSNGKKD